MADKETEFNSYISEAPDPAEKLEGDVKEGETKNEEVKDVEKLEVKVDDVPNSSGEKEESGEEVVKAIQKKILINEVEIPSDTKEDGKDIPDEFTTACLKQG